MPWLGVGPTQGQVYAKLEQALNNRPLFEANMKAINEAVTKAGNNLIKETVAVRIIGKGSAPHHFAPTYLLARDDQSGRIVGIFGKIPPRGDATGKLVNTVREVFKWQ